MNLLSRRSVLAIAAVVDVALHSRSAPVAAKALAARHKLPPRHLEQRLQMARRQFVARGQGFGRNRRRPRMQRDIDNGGDGENTASRQ